MKLFANSFLKSTVLALSLALAPSAYAEETDAQRSKAIADAAKAQAEANRTRVLTSAEKEKLEAETTKLIAEAYKLLSEANLNAARTQQIYQEIAALQQRMRMAQYEFERVAAADYELEQETAELERNANLVRPLMLGRANWKTWAGLEALIMKCGDADIVTTVMFTIEIPNLAATEFISNYGTAVPDFDGGNLGLLYSFARDNDLSFRPYGPAHQSIMKVVAMINKAVELKEAELRDINQSIRLTIVRIQN